MGCSLRWAKKTAHFWAVNNLKITYVVYGIHFSTMSMLSFIH